MATPHRYEYQGQVYSPAFSEPSSPASSTGSSAPGSPQLESRRKRMEPAASEMEFVSQRPRFANKYEEMLQPLSPVTVLPLRSSIPHRTHRSSLDVKLQRQFHQLVSLADEHQVEDFLSRHLAQLEVNGFNGEGRTALQQSCLEGNLSMAKVLVKYGADSQQSTRDGFSTFHLAVFSGHSPLMAYILSL